MKIVLTTNQMANSMEEGHSDDDEDVKVIDEVSLPVAVENPGCCGFQPKKYSWHHILVFLLTFFSYALFHVARKTFSNVKPAMTDIWSPSLNRSEWNATDCHSSSQQHCFCVRDANQSALYPGLMVCEEFLGLLDTVFLGCYAVGLFISGMLGDRFQPQLVLSIGMALSAITVFLFGYLTEVLKFYSVAFYVIIWGLSGLIQSSGWPTEVCVMGNWFGKTGRGFFLGLWSACASIGNILGAILAAALLPYGYEYTFLATAILLFLGAIVVLFALKASPQDVGLPDPDEDERKADEVTGLLPSEPGHRERAKPVGLCTAIMLPGVIPYSLAYACLKLVNYSFFFWLPFYLSNNFGWTNAVSDSLSVWYDWGGIIGGLIGGAITDLIGCRSPVVTTMLLLSMGSLFGYSRTSRDKLTNAIVMGITGFLIGGPANLISAAVSADLGRQPAIRGSSEALSTVTGIVDGTGSIGAALGQIFIPLIQERFSWHFVFYLFIVMTFLTAVCIIPLTIKDCRDLYTRGRNYRLARSVSVNQGEENHQCGCDIFSCCRRSSSPYHYHRIDHVE